MNNRTIYTYLRLILFVWMNKMKNLCPRIILAMLMSMMGIQAFAHDIAVRNADGVIIYYSGNLEKTELSVSFRGGSYDSVNDEYSGNVTIPESVVYEGKTYRVTSIGSEAFRGCSDLASVTIPYSVTSIGNYAFQDCSGLASIVVDSKNTVYDSRDNCNAIIETKTNTLIAGCKNTIIPNSVTSIGNEAFWGCSGLTSITIPNSVTSIGKYAFYKCKGLTSITIPNSVMSIGNNAFRYSERNDIVIREVHSRIQQPFLISDNVFQYSGYWYHQGLQFIYSTLYVPVGTKAKYQATDGWKNFKNIVEEEGSTPTVDNITFADAEVKKICVQNWDTNKDGELSKEEAAAVSDIGTVFSSTTIQSFNELQYFTGLKTIGEKAFWDCRSLASISIPSSVTSSKDFAFWGCTDMKDVHIFDLAAWCKINFSDDDANPLYYAQHLYLNNEEIKDLVIPNTVTSIGQYTFYHFSGITSITIPASVRSINSYAFSRCSGLTSIKVESGNSYFDSRNNCNAIIETGTNRLVVGCKNTVIPNTVTSIGTYAFWGCTGLLSVSIPNSVTSISSYAFNDCYNITSISVPNTVTSIGGYAFADCSALTSFTIPNKLTSIGDYTFYKCTGLTSITIPNTVSSIGKQAFAYCTGLTSVTIGYSTREFGNYAFGWCSNLKEVHSLSEWPTAINTSAFDYENVTLYVPVGAKAKYQAAEGWNNFPNIVEEGGSTPSEGTITFDDPEVKKICVANWDTNGDGELSKTEAAAVTNLGSVFQRNDNIVSFNELQYFTGLNTINGEAFFECKNLKSIILPSSVEYIEGKAFRCCYELRSLTIPKSVMGVGEQIVSYCHSLASIKVEDGNSVYDSRNNCNAIIESKTNTLIAGCKNTMIPNDVTKIGDGAFISCGFTTITIPNSVTSIGSDAFQSCALESITIPSSVTSISKDAFSYCSMNSIIVESGNIYYDSRDNCNAIIETRSNKLIKGCENTVIPNTVTIIGSKAFADLGFTSIAIPNSVTSIGEQAFCQCILLQSITIPNSVKSIEDRAFYRCYSLQEVNSLIVDPFPIFDVFDKYTPTLYVPVGTKAKYQAMEGWKYFSTIEEKGGSTPTVDNITFADAKVKAICVANWDTNGDGELSKEEAAAVTGLGEVFKNNTAIHSFNELQYFTGLTTIGEQAFRGCSSLASITIPNSVQSIGEMAFFVCKSLNSLVIPGSVISIGTDVVSYCTSLESISIENGNSVYDSRNNCNAIIATKTNTLIAGCKNTTIPNTVVAIDQIAFKGCDMTSMAIPNSVTSIGDFCFFECKSLSSITIPYSVRSIGSMIFYKCNSLTTINVESGNTVYDSRNYCNAIIESNSNTLIAGCKNSTIPSTVTSLGRNALRGCESLTSIIIPNSVKSIEARAFEGCIGMSEVHSLIEMPFAIDTDVFQYDSNNETKFISATLYVPVGTKAKYQATNGWKNFTNVVEEGGSTPTPDNITFADAEVKKICVQNWDTDGDGELSKEEAAAVTGIGTKFMSNTAIQTFNELQFFTGLKSISGYAFEECANLTAIAIPNTVTSIGDYAFYKCSKLANLIIHDQIINIGEWAFAYCASMTSFAMPKAASTIGNYAFAECEGLSEVVITDLDDWLKVKFGSISANPLFYAKHLYVNGKELKELVFPDNLTNIGDFLFTGSSLTSVTIPNTVKSIGSSVFYKCNNLKEVHSLVEQPFAIEQNVFQYKENNETKFTSATLYVPVGTKAKYQSTEGWKNFTNIVEEGGSVPADNITFADANVRALCVANWDTNHDGYLSKSEAATVTDLGEVFRGNRDIQSFDELQYFTRLTTIGEHAFHDCRGLTSITLPNSVTTIGFGAFWYCESLTSLVIPGSVETINQSAIFVCRSLTSITIPKSVTSIGIQNLNYCNNLTTVKVESGNTVYDSRNNCNAIIETKTNTLIAGCKGTTIPSTVTAIGRIAFQGSDLTTITIPNSVTSIGASCFLACKKLTTITIPSSVTTLGGTLFYGCEVLSTIKVESGNMVYDSRDNCNAIIEKKTNTLVAGCKNTIIPSTVTSIGANAFRSCYGLTSITIPNSVKSIEEGAFQDCTGLKEVHSLIERPFAIGMNVFQYDDNGETKFTSAVLYVPAGTKSKYQTTDGWKNFTNIVEEGGETPVVDNITFADATVKAICVENWDTNGDGELSKDEAAAVKDLGLVFEYSSIKTFDELQYFTGLTSIGADAFHECERLTSIVIPNSAKSIESSAFWQCRKLTSVTIPNSVVTIANGAFMECSNLPSITIPNSVMTIGSGAFADCSGLTTVSIGSSVTTIEDGAFLQTNILSLIWNSKTRLSQAMIDAFKENRSNLLIYVTDESVLPQSGMNNVVVSGTAQNIALKENSPFYSAQEFIAKNISFDHNFQMESGKGYAAGWEAITLPFDVTKIVHESKGELVPFAKYSAGSNSKPFWLCELTGNGFKRAQSIEANKPYIVCMPNHSAYSSEYCLNGRVIFSGTNVVVKKTDETNMITVSYNGMTFRPTYQQQSKDNTVYPINAVSDYTTETGYQTAGSIFIRNLRDVRPFEAYFKTASASVRAFVALDFVDEAVTGLEEVLYGIKTNRTDGIRIYSISGQLVRASKAKTLSEATKGLPAGVYVVNGKKMIVTL